MAGNAVASLRYNQKACSSHALTWSDDGRIAVATEGGVYIVELSCGLDSSNSLIARQVLIPASPVICEFDVGINREECLKGLPTDELYHIMLERTVSPHVSSSQTHFGCRSVQWSANGVDVMGRCILAFLSMDHRLCIYNTDRAYLKWQKVIDLSDKFYQYMKSKEFSLDGDSCTLSEQTQASLLKQRSYILATVAIAWSPVYPANIPMEPLPSKRAKLCETSSGSLCYLAAAMKSGHIVVWRVRTPCISEEDVSLHAVVDSGATLPVSIVWENPIEDRGILCVGYRSGVIKAHPVNHCTGELVITKTGFVSIWDQEDQLCVTEMKWMKEEKLLVASKGSFLIFVDLSITNTAIEVKSVKTFIGRNNLSISGLSTFPSGVVIGAQDGFLQKVQISRTHSGDIEIISETVLDIYKQYKAVSCSGTAMSRDSIFLAYLQGPRCFVDSRSEDCKLTLQLFITLNTPVEDTWAALAEGKFDILHNALASVAFANNRKSNLGQQIMDYVKHEYESLQTFPLEELHILRSLTVILQKHYQSILKDMGSQVIEEMQKMCDKIEERILQIHCTKWVTHISQEEEDLDEDSKTSVCLMCQALNNGKAKTGSNMIDTITNNLMLKLKVESLDSAESCNICGETIFFTNPKQGSCVNNHTFPRCCQSLLLVQKPPYRKCQSCGALSVGISDNALFIMKSILCSSCTYCAGVIV